MKQLSIAICLVFIALSSCSKSEESKQNNKHTDVNSYTVTYQTEKYKLYKTQNMWTFLKLNTSTGQIWQVQYSTEGDDYRFETPLNLKTLSATGTNGRFELYPTENIYNFIMLDTFDGNTYQVQWSNEAEKRCIIPIK